MGATSRPVRAPVSARGSRPLIEALGALRAALLEVGAPHMLIGGTAVILRGVARVTDDVDATVWAEDVSIETLLAVFARHEIEGRIVDVAEFARDRQVVLLRHRPSGTSIDVSLAWLPFEREALDRAETLDVEGVPIPVARVQDLIVYKAVAWRDRDRADIERLARTHRDEIDFREVCRIVGDRKSVV